MGSSRRMRRTTGGFGQGEQALGRTRTGGCQGVILAAGALLQHKTETHAARAGDMYRFNVFNKFFPTSLGTFPTGFQHFDTLTERFRVTARLPAELSASLQNRR